MDQIRLEDHRQWKPTDFNEDVAPASDTGLTQDMFGVVLISPV